MYLLLKITFNLTKFRKREMKKLSAAQVHVIEHMLTMPSYAIRDERYIHLNHINSIHPYDKPFGDGNSHKTHTINYAYLTTIDCLIAKKILIPSGIKDHYILNPDRDFSSFNHS